MLDQARLTEFPLFSDVREDKLSEIAHLCKLLTFNSREVIFKQGERAKALYGVLSGEVELSLLFEDKFLKTDIQYEESVQVHLEVMEKPIVFETIKPGGIFGWSALVSPNQLTATAQCAKPTQVFSLPSAEFKVMLDRDPTLGYAIMAKMAEMISRRLQSVTATLIEAWGEAFGAMKIIPENFNKKTALSIVIRGTIGIVGFILSPLSWWNDLFVNVPLSFAFAWVVGKFLTIFIDIHRWLFINLFVVGYFLTNLIGFLMIHYSIVGLKREKAGSIKRQALISLIYTGVILAFFGFNICNPEQGCKIFPSWVQP